MYETYDNLGAVTPAPAKKKGFDFGKFIQQGKQYIDAAGNLVRQLPIPLPGGIIVPPVGGPTTQPNPALTPAPEGTFLERNKPLVVVGGVALALYLFSRRRRR